VEVTVGKGCIVLSINQQSRYLQPATTVDDAQDRPCPEISSGCSSVYVASRILAKVTLTRLQKYNSNIVKRLPAGPLFSKEDVCHLSLSTYVPGCRSLFLKANLLNIHSHKYSGLTNSKVLPSANSSDGDDLFMVATFADHKHPGG